MMMMVVVQGTTGALTMTDVQSVIVSNDRRLHDYTNANAPWKK